MGSGDSRVRDRLGCFGSRRGDPPRWGSRALGLSIRPEVAILRFVRRALILAIALAGCGPSATDGGSATAGGEAPNVNANQNAPPPEPYRSTEQPTDRGSGTVAPTSGSGRSHEDAVAVCGPVESYRYVAEVRCPDGSQPLGGDPAAGQRARVGNVGPNATGHIIDLYHVPCPGGDVEVFVDMYGCAEAENLFGGP